MLSKILRDPRELLWQPNLGKNKQKLHRFQFCAKKIENFFHTNSKVFGVGEIKYAIINFQGAKRVAMTTKFGHTISVLRKNEDFLTRIVRFSGSANSNKLTEIYREPRELPWQPNVGKNKQKTHQFQFCAKKSSSFSHK